MAAHDGEVGHAHLPRRPFLDERHSPRALAVARPHGGHVLEEPAIDFENDLQVPRHDTLQQRDWPLFERLRQQRVVGICHARLGDPPGRVPCQVALVDEKTHQFSHGEGGMGIVQMNGDLRREGIEGRVVPFVLADDVAQAAGDEKVLLDQPQLLPRRDGIGRVQHLRDRFRSDFLLHRLQVVARVEDLHVEIM